MNKWVQTENALLHVAINVKQQSTLSISFEGVQTENTLLHVDINLREQSTLSISFEGVQTAYWYIASCGHYDNCSGQNQNLCMMQYLKWRVLTGRHKTIKLLLLLTGHNKFRCDWCFDYGQTSVYEDQVRLPQWHCGCGRAIIQCEHGPNEEGGRQIPNCAHLWADACVTSHIRGRWWQPFIHMC